MTKYKSSDKKDISMNLHGIREQIDVIDSKIVSLIKERMELSILAGNLKKTIKDEKREKEIIDKCIFEGGDIFAPNFFYNLYNIIFEESRRLQQK